MSDRVLRVVPATGEVIDNEALRAELDRAKMNLKLAEKALVKARLRDEFMLADHELRRQHYPRRAEVLDIMAEWREVTGRHKCRLTPKRFDAIRDCLEVKLPAPYDRSTFSRAIAGEHYDPSWVKRLKNGSILSVNGDIARICRDGGQFLEEAANRAPRGWVYVPRPVPEPTPRDEGERINAEQEILRLARMMLAEYGEPA